MPFDTIEQQQAHLNASPAYPGYHYLTFPDEQQGWVIGTHINGQLATFRGYSQADCEAKMEASAQPAPTGYSLKEDAERTFKALPWVIGVSIVIVGIMAIFMSATGQLSKGSSEQDTNRTVSAQQDINAIINVIHNPGNFVPYNSSVPAAMRQELVNSMRKAAIETLWEEYHITAN
jgi:hypothetical protein